MSQVDVVQFKPKMTAINNIDDLTIDSHTVCAVKADGEFNYLSYDRDGETFCMNRWNKKKTGFPALNEFVEAMNKTEIQKAELLVELYAMDKGRPLMLPNYIHYMKGQDKSLREKVFIGIWDLISINDNLIREAKQCTFSNDSVTREVFCRHDWKLEEVERWVKGCKRVHVLRWIKPRNIADVKAFWKQHVDEGGYEGLIVRNSLGIFKIKPLLEMDAVIIGINKRELMKEQKVTSLMLALLRDDMTFVEVGDVASGINFKLREAFWKLLDHKVGEDNGTIYVKPMVIVTVQFNAMYFKTRNRIFRFGSGAYLDPLFKRVGEQKLIKMRHPRVTGFRKDKIVCLNDVGLNQIPYRVENNG